MDKLSYALGISIAQNLAKSGVTSINIDDFKDGVVDTLVTNKFKISFDEANKVIEEFLSNAKKKEEDALKALKKQNRKEGEEYLKENAKKTGVQSTASGLQYRVVNQGTGKTPTSHSRVTCHYEGRFISGEKFDSSYDRGTPATFSLEQVIPGWTEGVQLMSEGSKFEFAIPYQLGYGEVGIPGNIPPCSTLLFTVELLKVL